MYMTVRKNNKQQSGTLLIKTNKKGKHFGDSYKFIVDRNVVYMPSHCLALGYIIFS